MTLHAMLPLSHIYEEPTVLSAASGHLRIFSQGSYKPVREAQLVPIIMPEAMQLARFFPLCWQRVEEGEGNEDKVVLVALRGLLPAGEGQPADSRNREMALPLVLHAFPLIVPGSEAIERQQLLFDRVIADSPTDIGAPLLLPNGKLSRAALMRAKMAVNFARGFPETAALSSQLLAAGLLEPWPLIFDLGHGESVRIEHLMVVAASRLDDGIVHDIVAEFGVAAGLFLGLHRTSLFRAGALLAAARAAVARRHAPDTRPAMPDFNVQPVT